MLRVNAIKRQAQALGQRVAASSIQATRSFASSTGFIATYTRYLNEYPVLTKSLTSLVIAGAGDIVCQNFDANLKEFSFHRFINMCIMGGVLVGPGLHFWYMNLAKWVPGTSTIAVIKRLALDQLLWAPAFIATFFSLMAVLQGKGHEIPQRLQTTYPDAVLANWKLWPAAQIINFKFVPLQHQVMYSNVIAVFWNAYLSWATNRDVVPADSSAAEADEA